tara:strand:- start:191 stop:880 length:690 start_codon:yes stop_codon:yes gene_type:complete
MKGYDLIIPVFKELKIIELLDYVMKFSKNLNQIFICYDFNEDVSYQLLKKSHYANNLKVNLIKNFKKGPCEAIKTCIAYSKSDSLIIYPADDYNNGPLLEKMYSEYLKGNDVVCPSRFMKGGLIKNCPLLKYLIVKTVSKILYLTTDLNIKDPTNGFRLFSKKIINKYKIESTLGFAFSLELLVKSSKDKFKIVELPSIWIERNDRKSSFKIFKWAREYLKWFFKAIFN